MIEFCLAPSPFIAYLMVSLSCLFCAIVQLFTQFKSTNKVNDILFGKPQLFFYLMYIGASILIFYISEVKGLTTVIENGKSNFPLMVAESILIGAGLFFAMKFNIKTENIEFGPGMLYRALIENVEARIDETRMAGVASDLKGIKVLPTPRAIIYTILPYCFKATEKKISEAERENSRRSCEAIFNSQYPMSDEEKATLILVELNQNFGIDTLKNAIEVFETSSNRSNKKFDDEYESKLESQEKDLDSSMSNLLQKNGKK
jgi:hypothetical protein